MGPPVAHEFARRHPDGRLPKPKEVADLIVFLASPSAASITGTEYVIRPPEPSVGARRGHRRGYCGLFRRRCGVIDLRQQRRRGIDEESPIAAAIDVARALLELCGKPRQLLFEPARIRREPRAHLVAVALGSRS